MAAAVILPKMPDHMESGAILRWPAKEGDSVRRGEVEPPADGVLQDICVGEGAISLDHPHQVRRILKVENARGAAREASPADIERLNDLLVRMEASRSNRQQFTLPDNESRRLIAETTRNPLLVLLLDAIRDLMSNVREHVWKYRNLPQAVLPDHRRIAQMIADHRPQAAARAMQQNLEHARAIRRDVLEERTASRAGGAAVHSAGQAKRSPGFAGTKDKP